MNHAGVTDREVFREALKVIGLFGDFSKKFKNYVKIKPGGGSHIFLMPPF